MHNSAVRHISRAAVVYSLLVQIAKCEQRIYSTLIIIRMRSTNEKICWCWNVSDTFSTIVQTYTKALEAAKDLVQRHFPSGYRVVLNHIFSQCNFFRIFSHLLLNPKIKKRKISIFRLTPKSTWNWSCGDSEIVFKKFGSSFIYISESCKFLWAIWTNLAHKK